MSALALLWTVQIPINRKIDFKIMIQPYNGCYQATVRQGPLVHTAQARVETSGSRCRRRRGRAPGALMLFKNKQSCRQKPQLWLPVGTGVHRDDGALPAS